MQNFDHSIRWIQGKLYSRAQALKGLANWKQCVIFSDMGDSHIGSHKSHDHDQIRYWNGCYVRIHFHYRVRNSVNSCRPWLLIYALHKIILTSHRGLLSWILPNSRDCCCLNDSNHPIDLHSIRKRGHARCKENSSNSLHHQSTGLHNLRSRNL